MSDHATSTATLTPRAGRREWLGLAVLVLPTLLLALDMTVLHLAAPRLSADLEPSSAELLWILDIYGFMVAGFLITMGTLGDRIGRWRLCLWPGLHRSGLCRLCTDADHHSGVAGYRRRHADALDPGVDSQPVSRRA